MEQKKISPGRVGIVGLGLIGGSLALDLQELGWQVRGLVHRSQTAEKAINRGLAQSISTDPEILSDCDLVILAMPLKTILNPDNKLLNALPKNSVITDVGSVKEPVLNAWRTRHGRFVPSHPMAGSSEFGVTSGRKNLFRNKPWIATPDKRTDKDALQLVQGLAKSIGSQWLIAEAHKHDQAVALISHLPVIISAALLGSIGSEKEPEIIELTKLLASSGFADTTRVGGGNPELGTAMAKNNKESILKALDSYQHELNNLQEAIIRNDWNKLHEELIITKNIRGSFLDSN